jgi:hypothetical protein
MKFEYIPKLSRHETIEELTARVNKPPPTTWREILHIMTGVATPDGSDKNSPRHLMDGDVASSLELAKHYNKREVVEYELYVKLAKRAGQWQDGKPYSCYLMQ